MGLGIQNEFDGIIAQNYWIKDPEAALDPDLQKARATLLDYAPEPVTPGDCKEPCVMTLRGPRRVGKSVAMKQLIVRLIQQCGWDQSSIIWFTAETARTMDRLEYMIQSLMRDYRPRLLCIDEVSGVRGWQHVIKKLVDSGVLADSVVILTGSSAYDLKSGSERMAGRRGSLKNPDRVLMPMSFNEFSRQVTRYAPGKSPADLCALYLQCGGFPFRVNQLLIDLKGNKPFDPLSHMNILDDVFFYEIRRRKLDRTIALEVMARIAHNACGALSYEGFAKALSISKDSVRRYLDALGDAFLVASISSYDTARGRVAPKKDRKFIWIDPALSYLASSQGQGPQWDEASRAESVVFAALLKKYERRLWEGLSAPRNVFTWKSSSGKEIDALVVDRSENLLAPVEVKWQNSISDWDTQVIERAFGTGVIVSKDTSFRRAKSEVMPLTSYLNSMD